PRAVTSHINELGQAVGIRINRGARIAFGADPKAANPRVDLYIEAGSSGTDAYWINNEGITVGVQELPATPGMNAGVWRTNIEFTNLNQALPANSGWTLLSANAINDAGVIVGTALPPS